MFRTRQLVPDPPTEINAASSISARGCPRLSSIFQLLHSWPQSKVKLILVGTTNENPPDGGHRAGTLAGLVRDTVPSGTPRPVLTAGFCAAKMGNWLVRQKAYTYDFQNALRKTMAGTARRQAK